MNEVVNRGVRLGNCISHNNRCGIDGRDECWDRKPARREQGWSTCQCICAPGMDAQATVHNRTKDERERESEV